MEQMPAAYNPSSGTTTTVPVAQPRQYEQSAAADGQKNNSKAITSINLCYFKSCLGVLAILIMVHSIIGFAVIIRFRVLHLYIRGAFGLYIFVSVAAIFYSIINICIGVLDVGKLNDSIPLTCMLVAASGLLAVLELISSILLWTRAIYWPEGVCTIIGFVVMECCIATIVISIPNLIKELQTLTGKMSNPPPNINNQTANPAGYTGEPNKGYDTYNIPT